MKIWTISDLHLSPKDRKDSRGLSALGIEAMPDADICVVAGDIADGAPERSIAWLAGHILPHMPVVVVLGNHDFYGHALADARRAAADAADKTGVIFLDNQQIIVDGMRFIGSTLWTDYWLSADDDPERRHKAMQAARWGLADHSEIFSRSGSLDPFLPHHAYDEHRASRDFINRALATAFDGSTVVITHHAPHPGSVACRFKNDDLTPAFVSNLSDLIEKHSPALWVHGHTHTAFDYLAGSTRIVCNPRGYRSEVDFDAGKIIEVGAKPLNNRG